MAQVSSGRVQILRWIASLVIAGLPAAAAPRSILVVGPHPDDETLLGGGRTRAAVLAGDSVHVVVVTNGDINGTAEGLSRQGESVAAAQALGVSEQDVVFLGYGDQLLETLWNSASGSQVYRSAAGQTATYGNRGLGGMDFHRWRTGQAGPYSRDAILDDFKALVTTFQPDEIYTVSVIDDHPDHAAAARFLTEALIALRREGVPVNAGLNQSIVWAPYANGGCYGDWPPPGSGPLPYPPFPPPQCVGPGTTFDWEMVQHEPVPADMQAPSPSANTKWLALQAYASQFNDFLSSFVRKDEFFWHFDHAHNLASVAQVTTSSDYPAALGEKAHAVDGFADLDHEWKSQEGNGAWIQLGWTSPVRLAQVSLYDRLDRADNVLAGTLSFSDGSTIAVGALPTWGKPLVVTFAPRTVDWVRFTLDRVAGSTPGLAEVEVLGVPAAFAGNVAPHFVRGPLASPAAIDSSQTSTLTVQAHDLDGDPLTYEWWADVGSVDGQGASAVYTPPPAGQSVATVSVRISDGRGGSAVNSAFVSVTAAQANALAVAPSSVAAGVGATGTVTISSPAPTGGVVVPLSSSQPAAAAPPASAIVPAGATSASFPIATFTVDAPTPVTITATFGGQTRSAALTVAPPVPAGLSLVPASAVGGNAVQATVTLTAGAPAAGLTLPVAVSDPLVATAPAEVTVAGGQASASFAIATVPVSSTRTLGVTVGAAGATASAVLTVSPLLLASLTVPASAVGGATVQGTATLNGPAGGSGAVIGLTSSDPTVAAVPFEVTVPPGGTTATFPVATTPVGASVAVTLTATLGGSARTAALTVGPAVPSALAVSPTSVVGGGAAAGTVTLNGAAPPGGRVVSLSSSNAAVASVPTSVAVEGGASSATFPVVTSPVSASATVTLSASLGGVTRTASLAVTPLTVSSLKLAPTSVTGGSPSTATVTMSAAAPAGGATVTLASDNAAAVVPATVTVAGGATTATFTVATAPVAATASARISARHGTTVTRTATLSVKAPALSTLAVAPLSVVGGTETTGTVTLTGPAPQAGFSVSLSSGNAAAQVPAAVVVPAGSASASFAVTTSAVTAVTSPRITASAGTVSRSVTLTVTPTPAVSAVALDSPSIRAGSTTLATVTLNAPAPPGGRLLTLRSSATAVATVPATATVAEGALATSFTVTARAVATTSTSSISAAGGGVTKSVTLTVTP